MPVVKRSFTAASFGLVLDGAHCGFVRSAEGGEAAADVIAELASADRFIHKHLGSLKYEDIILQIDLSMAPEVYAWIADSWNGAFERKNGAIVVYDAEFKARSQLEFFNALVVETAIPAMDGSSKDACFMTLKLAPEYTRISIRSDKAATQIDMVKQKQWLPSNFRLDIDGLDCSKVSQIDSFAIRQSRVDPIGERRDNELEPTSLEFPNLRIALAESGAQSWIDWYEDFVLKGNNGEDREKNGADFSRAK
jgi:hypothetical protein